MSTFWHDHDMRDVVFHEGLPCPHPRCGAPEVWRRVRRFSSASAFEQAVDPSTAYDEFERVSTTDGGRRVYGWRPVLKTG